MQVATAFNGICGDTRAAESRVLICTPLHVLHWTLTAAGDEQDRP